MSVVTQNADLAGPSVTNLASSPPGDDQISSLHPSDDPISALAIEFQHGRCGFAVILEEEHQLLLCEDLPCDFAFDDNDQLSSVRTAEADAEQGEEMDNIGAAPQTVPAFGHPSYGVVESCKP